MNACPACHAARRAFGLIALAAMALAGCSSEQAYGVGQAWQRTECNKIQDHEQRARCMSSAATSYEAYQRQSEAVKVQK